MEYESRGDKYNNLSLEEYLNIIRPYLVNMIDNHKAHNEWKIQLIMKINFTFSLDGNEIRRMHTKSDNIQIMRGIETNDIINEYFESFLKRYQEGFETKMKGSSFIFESVDLLYYQLHKISLKRRASYIDSPHWIRAKKATINSKNKDYDCFKYAITAALNYDKKKSHPEKISKLIPYINNYNWNGIGSPSHFKDWKKFEENNKTISLNILFSSYNKMQISPAYISKYNSTRDNKVILLMITDNDNNWHYLAVKRLSKLFRGMTSNNNGDFYCLNCLRSFRTKNKLEMHEKICKDHDFCKLIMPNENNYIIKYTPDKNH